MICKARWSIVAAILGAVLLVMAGCGGGGGGTSSPPGGDATVANRYAVIISGGVAAADNGYRYWNECAYFYATLKQNGFVDDQIYVVMSDGLNPSYDSNEMELNSLNRFAAWYRNSPVDLDADGRPDVRHPASKAAIVSIFDALSARVGPNDLLYIFVVDHGLPTGDNAWPYALPNVLFLLYSGETMTADEFKAQVDKVKAGAIVGIFNQCYSGGFVEKLAAPNRVLMSGVRWWESSIAIKVNSLWDFSAFSYYTTQALAHPELAGASGGSRTTLEEAYLWALAHEPYQSEDFGEHASYYSNPWDLGRRISLGGREPPVAPVYAGYIETETEEPYPLPGQAQGWHADDGVWTYDLPFSFPFGNNRYSSIHVSSNGILYFSDPTPSGQNTVSGLAAAVAAAPLWDDLTTADPENDIFIDATAAQVTIAWVAKTVTDARPVNVAARLQDNGVVTFFYGEGNDLVGAVANRDKTIGLSLGAGVAHYSLRNGASRLANAKPVVFTPK